MLRFMYLFSCLLVWASCARKDYYQHDALYQSNKINQPVRAGYVFATAGRHYAKGSFHHLIWGKHYRQIWAAPVQAPLLDLENLFGGLNPAELGGGLQTTSLTLQTKSGQPFTLRTLDKDPAKSLPKGWRATFLANIMRDQTSAINPYGAFVVPPLANAVGVPCTHPSYFYVPANVVGLQEYAKVFAGKMVMLEEKYKGEEALNIYFNTANDLIDSEKLIQAHYESPKNRLDQLAFAKARLFDVLLLDWDRHAGQWNWVTYPKNNGYTLFKPVPKDRDYVFYQYDDGVIPWLLTRKLLANRIKILKHNLQDVEGLVYKGRFLDERFLNKVTAEEWLNIASEMKNSLPDSLLQRAVSIFPDSVYKLTGERTLQLLKKRVDLLPELATDYYQLLAQQVTVAGTNQQERFVIKRLDNGDTELSVFSLPDNIPGELKQFYYRRFNHAETDKLILHGLSGDDEFMLDGKSNKGITVIIYGGGGTDLITDNSRVKGLSKKTKIFDTLAGNTITLNKESSFKAIAENTPAYNKDEF